MMQEIRILKRESMSDDVFGNIDQVLNILGYIDDDKQVKEIEIIIKYNEVLQ